MHTILIIGSFPEDPSYMQGGVQASVYGLAKTLKARSDVSAIEVISLPLKASSHSSVRLTTVEGIAVSYLQSRRFLASGITHLPFILKTIYRDRCKVVHIHGTGLLQCILLMILRLTSANCVWTLHGITAKETRQRYLADKKKMSLLRHWFYSAVEWLCIKAAGKIIVDTPYVVKEIRYNHNVHIIPQGIFSEEFPATQNNIAQKYPLVLSVGVLNPRKGHHHTIAAFERIREKIPDAQLVIAGAMQNQNYYARLKEQIKRMGVSGSARIITNPSRQKLLDLFREAKIFVLHSQEESQGIALCEALAAGLPVVATRSGGIPYVVTNGKDGYLVDYGDTAGFASFVISILNHTALLKDFSETARIHGRRFDWQNIGGKVMNAYLSK